MSFQCTRGGCPVDIGTPAHQDRHNREAHLLRKAVGAERRERRRERQADEELMEDLIGDSMTFGVPHASPSYFRRVKEQQRQQ